jgi:hypothetical protein
MWPATSDILLTIIKFEVLAMVLVSRALRQDRVFVLRAVKQHWRVLQFAIAFREDQEMWLQVSGSFSLCTVASFCEAACTIIER